MGLLVGLAVLVWETSRFILNSFPYTGHASWNIAKRIGALALVVGLIAGGEQFLLGNSVVLNGSIGVLAFLVESGEFLASEPVFGAIAFCAWYTICVITYYPEDKNNYRGSKKPVEHTAEHTRLTYALLSAIIPAGYFLIAYQSATTDWLIPALLVGLAYIAFLFGKQWVRAFTPILEKGIRANGTMSRSSPNEARSKIRNRVGFWLIITIGVWFFFDSTTAFILHIISMLWIARRFRWTLYEDTIGYKKTNPPLIRYGFFTRTPLMYALVILVLGGNPETGYAWLTSFAPLLMGTVYVLHRYNSIGGFEAKPHGIQMSKKEQYDAKMESAWIFGLVDVKITADGAFESKVSGVNRRIDRFTKKCKEEDLRPFIKPWEAPWITRLSDDPAEFDPKATYADLDAAEQHLAGNISHSDNLWNNLHSIRHDLRETEKFYNDYLADEYRSKSPQ
ncbi:hypothetical protein ACLI4Q_05685 [Natrialbaceae archaeon A-CW1-1]